MQKLILWALAFVVVDVAGASQSVVPREWLVIDAVDERGRRPFRPDRVFERYLLRPGAEPTLDEVVAGERGERTWRSAPMGEDKQLTGSMGYAFSRFEVPASGVYLAQLRSASTLFVDGVGYSTDVYGFGVDGPPVYLEAGEHTVFVTGIRGRLQLEFVPTEETVVVTADHSLPDLLADESGEFALGLELSNRTRASHSGLVLEVALGDAQAQRLALRRSLPALSNLRVHFPLRAPALSAEVGELALGLRVLAQGGAVLSESRATLKVRAPAARHLRSYVSGVDGSVQVFAGVPPAATEEPADMRLALSLHGAGVHAPNQAACYTHKPDFWVVCPTNRRPFGFDWQDWGRRDAFDVLERMLAATGVSPRRVYVTGHSMGGHGAWNVAANNPDRFAACAPSAGWESFDSYGGRPAGARRDLWHAADAQSSTLALLDNLKQLPIYILHGSADRSVRASEATTMARHLTEAGATFDLHIEGGAGHWWGNRCLDWEPIFELFRQHERPAQVAAIDFTSVDLGVDARHDWVELVQPNEYGAALRVRAATDEESGAVTLTTENVRRLRLWRELERVTIDDDAVELAGATVPVELERTDARWAAATALAAQQKTPARMGPFKRAFDREFVLVYGTGGTRTENEALYARARYDAQTWSYRGNGRAPLVSDAQFAAGEFGDRNLILYGNADTNSAFSELAEGCPIRVRRGELELGEQAWEGDGLGAVFVYPRRSSATALVGVFAASGEAATRVGYTFAPFVSGVGYPDYALFSARVLEQGDAAVLAAGWFAHDWSLGPATDQ